MRIALVIERFEPQGGGVEAVAWQAAHALADGDDEVHVFARQLASSPAVGITPHLLRVRAGWQPWRVIAFSRAAGLAAPRAGCDVVQSFSRTLHQDVYRAGGGCHAAYMERQYGDRLGRLRRLSPRHAVLLAVEARIFADPGQTVLCNSPMVRAEIQERFDVPDTRLAVVTNGVDLDRFDPERAREAGVALRQQLAPRAERVWLLVGSGFRRKGLEVALRALSSRPEEECLLVAGRDDATPWIARAEALGVAGRVLFLGPRDDLPAVYAASDALLLPTRYDAFANVCLEAAAMARPVVTSTSNGAAGWLGDAAIAVDALDDPEPWAEALGRLEKAEDRAQLGARGREKAQRASWSAHADELRALYRRVAR